MTPRKVPCAGCKAQVSENGAYMRCKRCMIYDIFCANVNGEMYDKLSDEHKKSWMCVECRSKIPKSGNSQTPVRQQLNQELSTPNVLPDISMHSPDTPGPDYVTLRTGARKDCYQNLTHKSVLDDMKESVVLELKKMQADFQTQLLNRINSLLTEQFLSFKKEICDKLVVLTNKAVQLEEQLKFTVDDNRPTEPTKTKGNVNNASQTPENKVAEHKPHPKPKSTVANKKFEIPPVALSHVPGKKVQEELPSTRPAESNLGDESTINGTWEKVRRRRSRASVSGVLRGTAAPGSTLLQASERWSYLHLYYVQEGTTGEQVRNHLTSICGSDICTIEELKSRGRYASFKLGVPFKNVESVMSPNNWTENICIKPWRQNFRAKAKSAPSSSPIS
ncbi:hypothetical protein ACJJTC_012977 [Scirpophaga incertulas]